MVNFGAEFDLYDNAASPKKFKGPLEKYLKKTETEEAESAQKMDPIAEVKEEESQREDDKDPFSVRASHKRKIRSRQPEMGTT